MSHKKDKSKVEKILMGIGNELKGDEGIGNIIAREFSSKGWLSLACETVPENFIGIVKKRRPKMLVIVDAANMSLPVGEFRIIPKDMLLSNAFGTHGIPLKYIVSYLERYVEKIVFIGIQIGEIKLKGGISPEVKEAKEKLIDILKRDEIETIKTLSY
ncbi:MAG: hydrogenase maturation peptidase HycI [Candidatus Aenigmatarchaeota archaeon]|nr:MAG: hydrogenase maturation peptidase HycI [Candidatus Aenigmarchaeota archaeon]